MQNHNKRYNINDITRETFYQLPKVFFSKHSKYEKMSLTASVAFSFLKDRFNYSIKNNWVDENGDIYFIFTNQELGETLKVKSKQTVVKIKKELESYGLLEQKRMGVNRPNRLYLLQPEVTATDVYEIQHAHVEKTPQDLATSGSPKNGLPKKTPQTLATSGSSKNGLPEKAPQTLATSGSPKNEHNLDIDFLDKKIHKDTHLDFSDNNYTASEMEEQNTDLVAHATDLVKIPGTPQFLNVESMTLIKSWCKTPQQINRFGRIILNAKKQVEKELIDSNMSKYTYLLDLEEIQDELTKWLRNYFNRVRNVENSKNKIKDYENYLFATLVGNFRNYVHKRLQTLSSNEL